MSLILMKIMLEVILNSGGRVNCKCMTLWPIGQSLEEKLTSHPKYCQFLIAVQLYTLTIYWTYILILELLMHASK